MCCVDLYSSPRLQPPRTLIFKASTLRIELFLYRPKLKNNLKKNLVKLVCGYKFTSVQSKTPSFFFGSKMPLSLLHLLPQYTHFAHEPERSASNILKGGETHRRLWVSGKRCRFCGRKPIWGLSLQTKYRRWKVWELLCEAAELVTQSWLLLCTFTITHPRVLCFSEPETS